MFRGGLRERKSWAVLRRLGKLSGTGVIAAITWDRLPDGTTDAQRATAIAETGEYALTMIIESAGEFADQDVTRHIWKAVTPDAGAQAAVFVAHGLAATTAKLAAFPDHHLNATAHERARSLLRGSFPWSEAEERAIAELADDDGWSEARLALVVAALSGLLGEEAVPQLPGLAAFYADDEPEQMLATRHWQICWNHAQVPYVRLADPDGFARWQATRAATDE